MIDHELFIWFSLRPLATIFFVYSMFKALVDHQLLITAMGFRQMITELDQSTKNGYARNFFVIHTKLKLQWINHTTPSY
jgi:hypothetical protein